MVFISLTSPSHFLSTDRSNDGEEASEKEVAVFVWAQSRVEDGGRANSIKSVYEGLS